MQVLRIAICEDDAATLDMISSSITALLSKRQFAAELTTASSADQLRREMAEKRFDLILLDIQMPKESGVAFAAQLREQGNQTPIIYVSSREDKLYDALNTQPFGFVRKRNFFQDIVSVLGRFLELSSRPNQEKPMLVLEQKNGVFRVKVEDIRYLEGSGKNQLLYLEGQKEPVTLHSTMDALEKELRGSAFLRVHKGYLVNVLYIRAILSGEVQLTDGTTLPLSRRRSQEIREQYLDLLKAQGAFIG